MQHMFDLLEIEGNKTVCIYLRCVLLNDEGVVPPT